MTSNQKSAGPSKKTQIDPPTRAILAARWTVGQLGFIAGTIPYLQAVVSEEAQAKARASQQLRYAIEVHRTLYAQNLAIQITSITDNDANTLSLSRIVALQRGRRVIADDVYRYAAGRHGGGRNLPRKRFDDQISHIAELTAALRATPHHRNVKAYRNQGVAHLTIDDYRTSFADMTEVAHDLFHIGSIVQSLFKDGVDQRTFTGLYRCHLVSAVELYGLTKPLESIFTQTTIEIRPREAPPVRP